MDITKNFKLADIAKIYNQLEQYRLGPCRIIIGSWKRFAEYFKKEFENLGMDALDTDYFNESNFYGYIYGMPIHEDNTLSLGTFLIKDKDNSIMYIAGFDTGIAIDTRKLNYTFIH